MENLRPNQKRAKWAIIAIWTMLVLELISFFSGYLQYQLLNDMATGIEVNESTALANDLREGIIGILTLIIHITTIVLFIMWFRRAYYNLHIKVKDLQYREGWAAGCWFVPFVNLYRPYQIMKEIYNRTEDLLEKSKLPTAIKLPTTFVGIWWTFWIISNLFANFVFRYSLRANEIDELINSSVFEMISNVIELPLAFLAVKVIKDYNAAEVLLADLPEIQTQETNESTQTATPPAQI